MREGALYLVGIFVSLLVTGPASGEPAVCADIHGLKFMDIPGGTFWMGSNKLGDEESGWGKGRRGVRVGGSFKDELPRHRVKVENFCMMKKALSVAELAQLRDRVRVDLGSDNERRRFAVAGDKDEPARLTWVDAGILAQALGKSAGKLIRLPTEAEWEYGARGGLDSKHFPWGDIGESYKGSAVRDIMLFERTGCRVESVGSMARTDEMKRCLNDAGAHSGKTPLKEVQCFMALVHQAVPEAVPNGFGLINLVNNEWEWTSSKYMPYPYDKSDGREGPARLKKEYRVIRGGNNDIETCLGYSALRGYSGAGTDPNYQGLFGVRFVLEK